MLQDQLELLNQEFTALKDKIKTKLASQAKTLTETTQKLNETNHKLELLMKENSENEKVLEQLLREFKELEASL